MSTAQSLGQALGLGVQTGVQTGLQQLATNFNNQLKREDEFEKNRQKNIENIDKIRNATLKNNGINPEDVGSDKLRELTKLSEQGLIDTGDPLSALRVTQDYIDQQIANEGKEIADDVIAGKPFPKDDRPFGRRGPTKGGRTFIDDLKSLEPKFKRGFTRESVAASLLGNQLTSEEVAAKAIENPTFAEELAEQTGTVAADLPFLAIGSFLGGPVGALALPSFLGSAADEIWNLARDEDKITLAKGGKAALDVALKTAKGATTGAILKKVPGLVPALKRIPGAEKYLNNFIAEKLIDIGATSTVLSAAPAALEGRLPTSRDFASALALTLGFESLAIPEQIKRNIEAKGEKSGLTPEEFSKRVQTEATEKGVDFEKVQAGQGKETQKFNRIINDITREEAKPTVRKARKVAEEVPKPEITKERLIEREKETKALARKAAKSPVEAFSESVRATERPSKAQIFDQITKSFDKIKTEIRKPELVDPKKVERRAELDKRAIDKANDIIKRGELLSEVEQDTFLRIKKEYTDAYKDMMDFNKEFIEDNRDSKKARIIRDVREAEKMNQELSNRLKRAEADITLQKNKRAIQKLSKGAKGSFFRNQLKKLRTDIETLQNNIFKQNKLKSQAELKAQKAARRSLSDVQKIAEDFTRKQTESNTKELSEITNESPQDLTQTVKSFGDKLKDAFEKTSKKGQKAEKEAAKSVTSEITKLLNKYQKLGKLNKAIVSGIVISAIQNASEALTGTKPSAALLALFVPAGKLSRAGGATIASVISKIFSGWNNRTQSEKFKKVLDTKNPIQINKARRELKEKYSPKRVKEIEKLAKAA